eukprot:TRINITY_DN12051_c0_g1_i5.p1 TRINITY_DN12051_c0_g1~~TRINITY_DN12051_c0_g1_i5.p1  ORF type:complete len:115 (-),score=12.90 TRINITY_DN12051_c0_g1_i5:261-605(-)
MEVEPIMATIQPIQDTLDPAPDPTPLATTPEPAMLPTLRRTTHVSRPPDRYGSSHLSFLATLASINILTSYSQVVKHECWQKAMSEELEALQTNHTWDVVTCPPTIRPIGCKWV